MKLLTLNTHSLQGEDPEKNLEALAAFLLRERPGVAAFQEVNQLRDAAPADPRDWRWAYPSAGGTSPPVWRPGSRRPGSPAPGPGVR